MKIRAFLTHKLCEHYADCQDRFCINEDNRIIALSDGMSQSIFPDYWAEILSEQYAKEGHCNEEDRKKLCDLWMQRVIKYRNEQIEAGKDPWKLDNFLASRKGAGATLCGVRFENATDWKGDVLGDSCIIKVNTKDWKMEILTSEEKAFDSFPDFYDSFPEKLGRGTIKSVEGCISPDDILLLVSDPFSEYLYKNKEQTEILIGQILKLTNHEAFCKLVDDWRTNGMHNDDSTLCVIEFDGDIKMNISHQDYISSLMQKEKEEGIKEKVVSTISQVEAIPDNASLKKTQGNSLKKEKHETSTYETTQDKKLQEFCMMVLRELDTLLSSKNNGWFLVRNESVKKDKIIEIRRKIAKKYEELSTAK